jgi:hypothetical protein
MGTQYKDDEKQKMKPLMSVKKSPKVRGRIPKRVFTDPTKPGGAQQLNSELNGDPLSDCHESTTEIPGRVHHGNKSSPAQGLVIL